MCRTTCILNFSSSFYFSEVSYSEEFLTLSLEKVQKILSRNRLAVQTEDAIFDAVLRWVRHDVANRQQHLEGLITGSVHMGLLDERYVKVSFGLFNCLIFWFECAYLILTYMCLSFSKYTPPQNLT